MRRRGARLTRRASAWIVAGVLALGGYFVGGYWAVELNFSHGRPHNPNVGICLRYGGVAIEVREMTYAVHRRVFRTVRTTWPFRGTKPFNAYWRPFDFMGVRWIDPGVGTQFVAVPLHLVSAFCFYRASRTVRRTGRAWGNCAACRCSLEGLAADVPCPECGNAG